MWFIKTPSYTCEYRDWDDVFEFCTNFDSNSQWCQEETCPLRVEENKEEVKDDK